MACAADKGLEACQASLWLAQPRSSSQALRQPLRTFAARETSADLLPHTSTTCSQTKNPSAWTCPRNRLPIAYRISGPPSSPSVSRRQSPPSSPAKAAKHGPLGQLVSLAHPALGGGKLPPFLCRLGATANAVSQPDRQPRGWRDYGVGRNIAVLPRWFVRRPCLPLFEPRAHQSTSPFHPRPELYFPFRSFRAAIYHASHHRVANIRRSQSSIIGAYVIIFGIATALLEYQIPPQISRYASFLFSFIGRGVCKFPLRPSWCRFGSALVGVSLLTTARPQQSTFSSGPFSSTATSCASSPDPSSALSVWYTWPSNTFPPLSRRRTCGRPIKAGAPSKSSSPSRCSSHGGAA